MSRVIYKNRLVGWIVSIAFILTVLSLGIIEFFVIGIDNNVSARTLFEVTIFDADRARSHFVMYDAGEFVFLYPEEWITNIRDGIVVALIDENSRGAVRVFEIDGREGIALEEFARAQTVKDSFSVLSVVAELIDNKEAVKIRGVSRIRQEIVRVYIQQDETRDIMFQLMYAEDLENKIILESLFDEVIETIEFK